MEEKFLYALEASRQEAAMLGVRIRPIADFSQVRRCLSSRRCSDGFYDLADTKRLDLCLEALAVKKQFACLFTDDEANTALQRLLDAGYNFR